MCRATHERGGPRRCSGDTLTAYETATTHLALLTQEETELTAILNDTPPAPSPPAPTLFAGLDREERVTKMRAEIDTAIAELGTQTSWQNYLNFASKFRARSLRNQLLIQMQCPGATYVLGRKAWINDHDRRLIGGVKAIWIYAPLTKKEIDPKTGEETRRMYGVKPVPVYDVSQTDGKPLPEPPARATDLDGDAPAGMVDEISAALDRRGFPVSYEDLGPNLKGYTSFNDPTRVVINSRSSGAQRAKTLAHELAHVELGHGARSAEYHSNPGGHRPDMEVEAESTAYIISQTYGLDTGDYSFGYIDGWAKGDKERITATASSVITGATKLLTELNR